ncbi:MAG: tRNA (N6-isopentenyl adenosine(37)-C2)-methylthiotransferase MiaB [Candidatus Eisenbacteria bacterium]|uniref:tRNA-2-methylthio-N(6)-dimethylallyladenosine synthase n=1 Tax=Eiseniibacteriota bacterium TaxID=2212470 RepID=A0A956RP51_UNCEI|nr:tRNA (N6-isopentenyl adenosine(37)-C2)-methylthiotransferase MiaB [Candidatus Eisenbacteria bacterium]
MKRVYIETYGCQMNVADSALMSHVLEDAGFRTTEDVQEASLVLLNTCAIRERAEDRVRARIRQLGQLKRIRPDLVLGVTGCMPKHLGKELLDRLPQVDLFLGPDSYRRLPELVEAAAQKPTLDLRLDDEDYSDLDPVSVEGVHAFVPIMRGCDRFCTFCVVPLTRGREKSLPLDDVIRQVESAVAQGARAVTLLGQTVNSWHHGAHRFVHLLDHVSRVPGLLRVRFTSPHPAEFEEEVFALMAERPGLCPQLHLPVQSGSDRMLEAMKRGHDRAQYRSLVDTIRRHLPDAGLSTDIIVAYPGESEEDFAETCSLIEEVRYDSAFLFRYSPRSGTYAHRKLRAEEIADEIAAARLQRVIELQERISHERYTRWVGRAVEVLVEGVSRRDPAHLVGKSADGKTVILPGGPEIGTLVRVEIGQATSHTLLARGVHEDDPVPGDRAVEQLEV